MAEIRTIFDYGPITIKLITYEKRSRKGQQAYRVLARQNKYCNIQTLNKIRLAIEKELRLQGALADKIEKQHRRRCDNPLHFKALALKYYNDHKEEINRRRRDKRKRLKQSIIRQKPVI